MRCLPSVSSEGHLTGIDGSRRTVRARAGLDDVRIHDIRRSFASRALAFPAPSSWGLRLEDRTGDPIGPYAVIAPPLGRHIPGPAGSSVNPALAVHPRGP